MDITLRNRIFGLAPRSHAEHRRPFVHSRSFESRYHQCGVAFAGHINTAPARVRGGRAQREQNQERDDENFREPAHGLTSGETIVM